MAEWKQTSIMGLKKLYQKDICIFIDGLGLVDNVGFNYQNECQLNGEYESSSILDKSNVYIKRNGNYELFYEYGYEPKNEKFYCKYVDGDKAGSFIEVKLNFLFCFSYQRIENLFNEYHRTFNPLKTHSNWDSSNLYYDVENLFSNNVWYTYDNSIFMEPVPFSELKVGEKYLYHNNICTLKKLYDYPNNKNAIGQVMLDRNSDKGLIDAEVLYYIPYLHDHILLKFNDNVREELLQPKAETFDSKMTIYWNKIKEAASYIVSIYKLNIVDAPENQMYFLKECIVSRDTRYFTISDLPVDELVVVVSAEDREGNIISKSRGIYQGKAIWW